MRGPMARRQRRESYKSKAFSGRLVSRRFWGNTCGQSLPLPRGMASPSSGSPFASAAPTSRPWSCTAPRPSSSQGWPTATTRAIGITRRMISAGLAGIGSPRSATRRRRGTPCTSGATSGTTNPRRTWRGVRTPACSPATSSVCSIGPAPSGRLAPSPPGWTKGSVCWPSAPRVGRRPSTGRSHWASGTRSTWMPLPRRTSTCGPRRR
mmetsp:Transcript_57710/g.175772  ORF Transcript_57710/g.175772 Transcript_57710/m.175772 type:complete len:208 (+) Transcript_57710:478-1101(+)